MVIGKPGGRNPDDPYFAKPLPLAAIVDTTINVRISRPMTSNINDTIKQIEHLMYGYNFEVCIGIDIFNGKTNIDFEKAVKEKYPNTNPQLYPLSSLNKDELLDDIIEKLNFRGDTAAGLTLTEEKEIKLKALQQKYLDFIGQFINEQTKYFYYSDPDGIPGYPVFWDYRYVLFADNDKIVLVYGSSSD